MAPSPQKTVFVGVSGGVDSSVSAYLLKQAGYNVVGVFIKTWQPEFVECTWRQERRDAIRVCAHLDIPFLFFDFEDEYKKGVGDYMIAEYRAGRTPNPDVMCNKEIKFGAFYTKARAMGADYIATGHYALHTDDNLHKSKDSAKDQTYFLWTMRPDILEHVLFPVGHLEKSEVRAIAEKVGLPTATKKDSQGICFIGPLNMKEFLREYIPLQVGTVVNEEGSVIGTHDGVLFYTLGERHGFTITKKTPHDGPWYVVGKDVEKNILTVSQHPKTSELIKKEIMLHSVNWISNPPTVGKSYTALVRYGGVSKECVLKTCEGNEALLSFSDPELVSAGQSVVIYDEDSCLGGGIVKL